MRRLLLSLPLVAGACAEPTLTLVPSRPTTVDELQASYAGPRERSVRLRWRRDGAVVVDGAVVPAALTAKGQVWYAEAVVGERVLASGQVTVLNTPPTVEGVQISPAPVRPTAIVGCEAQVADADGDTLSRTIRWWVDGLELEAGPSLRVPASARLVRCEVEVDDGEQPVLAEQEVEVDRRGFGGNLLWVVADDLGVDKLSGYGQHDEAPDTPVIDQLMQDGAWYTRAWASPTCSPSRSAMLTGRQTHRYDIGSAIKADGTWGLPLEEVTLPEALAISGAGYAAAGVGKWHLTPPAFYGEQHPLLQGFGSFTGSLDNLNGLMEDGTAPSYTRWPKWDGAAWTISTTYATTDTVDDAVALLGTLPEPWLLYVAFNAPHDPFELPPVGLFSSDATEASGAPARYGAMVEALDTELGRLLEAIEGPLAERTTVVFVADNGTPKPAVLPPFRSVQAKGTPYEGGVRVPLVIRGPAVADPGWPRDQLVHVMDLFPTLLELSGVDVAGVLGELPDPVIDGVSLVPTLFDARAAPVRETMVSLGFRPAEPSWREGADQLDLAVRDERWKLIRPLVGDDVLYDLGMAVMEPSPVDPAELNAQQLEALDRLRAQIDDLPRPPALLEP